MIEDLELLTKITDSVARISEDNALYWKCLISNTFPEDTQLKIWYDGYETMIKTLSLEIQTALKISIELF